MFMSAYYKKFDLAVLEAMVKESITYSELMRRLGYTHNRGNSYVGLKKYLEDNHIDTSHFKGKAHGLSKNYQYGLANILVKDGPYSNMTSLKKRILQAGLLIEKCAVCGIQTWQGKPIVLQLDHINGDNRDNRIENLRLLCPNCHSQTESFCGKNRGKKES